MKRILLLMFLALGIGIGTMYASEGALKGEFSVSATQKVHFSQGNLQYKASTNTWRFAGTQYDIIGNNNSKVSSSYSGWIDLFTWGSSGYEKAPYSNGDGLRINLQDIAGTKYDWGVYCAISNGGNVANRWRTLTKAEWEYLINGRPNATSKRALGTVNGKKGLIVLPDNWELPEGCTFQLRQSENVAGYETNEYTIAQWGQMEAAGAIFLPAAGVRTPPNYSSNVTTTNVQYWNNGVYWSTTSCRTSNSPSNYVNLLSFGVASGFGMKLFKLRIGGCGLEAEQGLPSDIRQGCGASVRLVQNSGIYDANTIHVITTSSTNGTVTGGGEYNNNSSVTLTAIPDDCYEFTQWSDGNTNNPRTIIVTEDATYTAEFSKIQYAIHFNNYDGTPLQNNNVDCGTTPAYTGETPTKPADAQYTYTFAGWDKEVVAVTGDATYTAVFEPVLQCGTIETTDGITVWEDQLPYTWEGISFTTAGTETKTLQASDGCDSIVTFTLRVLYRNITLQENESADYYTQFAQDYNGQRVNTATLNRQFTQGRWATLCLPFNVNKAMMMALGLYNRVFAFRYAQQLDDETIQVFFVPAQSIEAGKGYIVNPNAKLAAKTSFVFPNVTINTDSDNGDITALTGYNDGTNRGNLYLVGTLRTGILQGSTAGNTYLGLKDNQLYYPNTTSGTSIRAYRGFFRSDIPVNVSRVRIIADGETVSELQVVGTAPTDWSDKSDPSYTPARKYLRNGILYIDRNGITYTAQGQRLD